MVLEIQHKNSSTIANLYYSDTLYKVNFHWDFCLRPKFSVRPKSRPNFFVSANVDFSLRQFRIHFKIEYVRYVCSSSDQRWTLTDGINRFSWFSYCIGRLQLSIVRRSGTTLCSEQVSSCTAGCCNTRLLPVLGVDRKLIVRWQKYRTGFIQVAWRNGVSARVYVSNGLQLLLHMLLMPRALVLAALNG